MPPRGYGAEVAGWQTEGCSIEAAQLVAGSGATSRMEGVNKGLILGMLVTDRLTSSVHSHSRYRIIRGPHSITRDPREQDQSMIQSVTDRFSPGSIQSVIYSEPHPLSQGTIQLLVQSVTDPVSH